jgi:pSer/pThr/pTyr-binding forkhead associated (FHA) protein
MMSRIYKIGRDDRNDIVLEHPSIADFHAEVFVDPHQNCFFTDLKSPFGSTLNGKKLNDPVILNPKDELVLGEGQYFDWELIFFNRKTQVAEPKPTPKPQPAPQKEKKAEEPKKSIPSPVNEGFVKNNMDLILIFGGILFLLFLLGFIA